MRRSLRLSLGGSTISSATPTATQPVASIANAARQDVPGDQLAVAQISELDAFLELPGGEAELIDDRHTRRK